MSYGSTGFNLFNLYSPPPQLGAQPTGVSSPAAASLGLEVQGRDRQRRARAELIRRQHVHRAVASGVRTMDLGVGVRGIVVRISSTRAHCAEQRARIARCVGAWCVGSQKDAATGVRSVERSVGAETS
jgi:hypothetical protein